MESDYMRCDNVDICDSFEINSFKYHCFFGYYDKTPFDDSDSKVLYISVPIKKQSISPALIIIRDINTNSDEVIDKTYAWNWQQGAMLQWTNKRKSEFIYNVFDERAGCYGAKVFNMITSEVKEYNKPIYSMAKKSNRFLSLNFYRLNKFAKGYGYDKIPKEKFMSDDDDGIWDVNMETSEVNLVLTLGKVIKYKFRDAFVNSNHYINHADYCYDDRKIIFIHRWFGDNTHFDSRLLIFDMFSGEIETLLDYGHVSHFCWKSDKDLLIYATNKSLNKGYFNINIENGKMSEIIHDMPSEDGHPSYSPDKKYILTDTYPDAARQQNLLLYELQKHKLFVFKSFYSPIKYFDENRCDLHPRWSNDGRWVAVDTTYSGKRSMCFYKISL
ncbi:hypothetical protein OO006_02915 [Prosthecochloris sp. SCSIO W1101]|uniref:hypothetical protein n=1 Tax=Prosthecochloris sp. SCSIO W1101 TaxID=2992242 RepID=UPI00223C9F2C|nr:hypothetical protein [Prosthecochloris sp. SCSIO W1101]UZJ41964.1 hypothetical protein OO006_02915 [Prosthecochloris sp. SCSIO W1101]